MTKTTLFAILSGIPSVLYALFHDMNASATDVPLKITQRKVLIIIETLEGATMTHISHMAGLKKGSFTSVADSLIEAGYVERGEDPADRRKVILRLTPEGKAVARRIINRIELHLENKLSRLEPSQRRELMNAFMVLSRYADRLK
jgi:DNA-binding MarR family transcriptional regulator